MSVWGDDLNGADFNTQRTYGMSVKAPPDDYRWHHYKCEIGMGQDSTVSPLAMETKANHRAERSAWLDQFDLEITEDGVFRYWRWYDGKRTVRWSERRLVSARLPKVPGFWPSDE